jgi:hypothetical protein
VSDFTLKTQDGRLERLIVWSAGIGLSAIMIAFLLSIAAVFAIPFLLILRLI